ncbi:hypothetical protein IAD21_03490 [Abditibacteriota bacterium]|nr:hypothetical protein IAD21_03490 [Abditibacteriota bacterium]
MNLFRAPEPVPTELLKNSLFLAGGIGIGAIVPDWQSELIENFRDTELTLINPRRDDYPTDDPGALRQQIEWEHRHLKAASAISFWFVAETLCPITLYELGSWANRRDEAGQQKPIFVGVHPDYTRRADLFIQLSLVRPEVQIVDSITELELQIRAALGLPHSI